LQDFQTGTALLKLFLISVVSIVKFHVACADLVQKFVETGGSPDQVLSISADGGRNLPYKKKLFSSVEIAFDIW